MDAKLAQDKIKTALKQLLKRQGQTYADVAKVWRCSVPTVKRQLGPEELPVSRMLTLLEWLGLTLRDLQELAESEALDEPKWTNKQLEVLAKNPRLFAFVMKLYDDMTPEQIAKRYNWEARELERVLIQLERHDLIKIFAGGKVRPVHDKVPSLDGPLAIAHIRNVIDRLAQYHKTQISDSIAERQRGHCVPKGGFGWEIAEISEKSYLETVAKIRQIFADLSHTAQIETKTLKKSELKIAVLNHGFFLHEMNDARVLPVRNLFDTALENDSSTDAELPARLES